MEEEKKRSKSKSSSRSRSGCFSRRRTIGLKRKAERNPYPESNSLFILSTLGRLKEKHLLLNDRVVLHHAERTMDTGPDHRAVVARHGHRNQPDGNGTGLRCAGKKTTLAISRKGIRRVLEFRSQRPIHIPIAYGLAGGSCD